MSNYDLFINAIKQKKIVNLKFNSYEKGVLSRECVPFDYGPSNIYHDGQDRYHFSDLDSPSGSHNLSILPSQVLSIQDTNQSFDPADYVTWDPNWFISRDWGKYS